MKTTIIIKGMVVIVAIVLQTQILFAQWQFGNAGTFTYGRTNNNANVGGIGIGSFPNGTPPLAALHINTNAPFPTNTFWNPGEVFRTDCPTANAPFWRMFRGGTERARFYNPLIGFGNGLVMETVNAPGGWMAFNTALTTRMFIRDGGNLSTDGFVGVGNSFTSPVSRLHQHEPYNTFNYHQFTNANTGATSTDGLKVGIDATGTAQVMQQENKDMAFYTDNTQRLTITATGSITINSLCSNSQTIVTADKNGTLTTTTAETIIAQSQTIIELKQKITGLETIINQLTAQNFKTEGN